MNSRVRDYGIAVLITGLILLLSLLLRPLIESQPFLIFFVAVALSAGIGGLGPGLVASVLSVLAIDYFFVSPYYLLLFTPTDLLRIVIFMTVAAVVSVVYDLRKRTEEIAHRQREQLSTTLQSIGDAVISTDELGRINLMNPVAESLTGWRLAEATGKEIGEVFHIVNDQTGDPVANPVNRVLREGLVVGLANHTILIARDGTRRPIDDSGAPIRDAKDRLCGAVLTFRDITQRRRAEERQRFLSEATTLLASSLDFQTTLASVARLAVPTIADWCVVHIVQADNSVQQLALTHVDPAKIAWVDELQKRFPPDPTANTGVYQVIRTGKSEFFPEITDEMLVQTITDPEILAVAREFRFTSAMAVPLQARGRILGAIQFVTTESGRHYDAADLTLAEDLAARAAIAVDNARLYRDAQQAQVAAERSAQEQQQARARAELAQERLRVTLASIGDAAIATDEQGCVTFINPIAQNLTGWTEQEAIGKDLHEVFHIVNEKTRQVVENPVTRIMREGVIVGLANHTVLIARDGRERPIDDSGAPIRDASGKISGAILIFRDATEQRRTHQLEVQLAAIVRGSDDAIIGLDLNGIVTSWNWGAEQMYLFLEEEMTGKHISMLVPPDWPNDVPYVLERIKRGERIVHYETKRMRKDGVVLDVLLTVSPVHDEDGNIIGASKIARDITERKRAEETTRFLDEVTTVLNASLDYQSTLEAMVRLVIPRLADYCTVNIAQENGTIVQVAGANQDPARAELVQSAGRRFLLDPEAMHGSSLVIRTGKPELVPDVTPILGELAQNDAHLQVMRDVGLTSYLAMPLRVGERTFGAMVLTMAESGRHFGPQDVPLVMEVARRAAIAVENARLYREAQQAVKLRDEFLSVAAHELKTPVTSLLGFSQLLLRQLHNGGMPDTDRLERALKNIQQQSDKLTRLITQLLDISRIQAGRLKLDTEVADVTKLVESAVEVARYTTSYHVITLRNSTTLFIMADPLRFEQVLTNLLDNAIKYSPDGGPIEVAVSQQQDQVVRIAVTDHGIGIPEDRRSHIFDRFYQAHEDGRFGGMGLGLYISRQIVELHGGQLYPEFPPEGGTRFVVIMPSVPQPAAST